MVLVYFQSVFRLLDCLPSVHENISNMTLHIFPLSSVSPFTGLVVKLSLGRTFLT